MRSWLRHARQQASLRRLLHGEPPNPSNAHTAPLSSTPHWRRRIEAKEIEEALEPRRIEIRREHSKSHCGGMRGLRPVLQIDNRSRASSALHRRMNACGNNLSATFLKVAFSLKMRQEANALLAKCKLLWKFPEKAKKRASTPLGNDSRKFHSNKELLVGLFKIFYADEA